MRSTVVRIQNTKLKTKYILPSHGSHVLSDVDGTILQGSLVLEHAVSLHNQERFDLGSLPAQWMDNKKNEHLISTLAEAYRDAISGQRVEDLGIEEFLDTLCENDNSFYSSMNRLLDYRANGSEVTLISGSPHFLVSSFAERYGFNGVGSEYHTNADGELNGNVRGMFGADAKREYVADMQLHHDMNIHAYGDTPSDAPLFEAASYSVLVAPNDTTLTALEHTVDEILEH